MCVYNGAKLLLGKPALAVCSGADMDDERASRSHSANSTWAFVQRYFSSPVSLSALVFALLAFASVWASATENQWWRSYLQNLSTTFLGIAATVWLVNFWGERQNDRLLARISKPAEEATLLFLCSFVRRAQRLFGADTASNPVDPYELERMSGQLDILRRLCDPITPATSAEDLRVAVADFKSQNAQWSMSFSTLGYLIDISAPQREIDSARATLGRHNADILRSAVTLYKELDRLHPDLVKLKLNDGAPS